jgi:hypothetical protein
MEADQTARSYEVRLRHKEGFSDFSVRVPADSEGHAILNAIEQVLHNREDHVHYRITVS